MNEPVDAVYTWVNGSDPEFIKSLEEFQTNNFHQDMVNHRFEGLFFLSSKAQMIRKSYTDDYIMISGR